MEAASMFFTLGSLKKIIWSVEYKHPKFSWKWDNSKACLAFEGERKGRVF